MGNRNGREAIPGAEELMVDIIFELLPSEKRVEVLKALVLCAVAKGNRDLAQHLVNAGAQIGDELREAIQAGTQVDDNATTNGRDALRGAEAPTLDLVFEVLTSEQLAELLQARLVFAAVDEYNKDLAQMLVRA